jgi:hypothetical protein
MIRVGRSAWSERTPAPLHSAFKQNWRSGKAPGLLGRAWLSQRLERANLGTQEVQQATEQQWDYWLTRDDPRSTAMSYQAFKKSNWFSTIWCQPMADTQGVVNGMITVNVELRVRDGFDRLVQGRCAELLHKEARTAGQLAAHA